MHNLTQVPTSGLGLGIRPKAPFLNPMNYTLSKAFPPLCTYPPPPHTHPYSSRVGEELVH